MKFDSKSTESDGKMALTLELMNPPIVKALPDFSEDPEKWLVLQNFFQPKPKPIDLELHRNYLCPITHLLFCDPVLTCDGYTYEREAIQNWFNAGYSRSPHTNTELENKTLTPNRLIKEEVDDYLDKHPVLKDSNEWYLPQSRYAELQNACDQGNENEIKRLVNQDQRILVFASQEGNTALHLAVINPKALDVVIGLLEKRHEGLALAGLLQMNERGLLPFHVALEEKQSGQTLIKLMTWMGKQINRIKSFNDLQMDFLQTRPINEALALCIENKDEVKSNCLRRLGAEVFNKSHQSDFQMGVKYFYLENGKALPYLDKASHLAYPPSELYLGMLYENEPGTNNKSKAIICYENARVFRSWFHSQAAAGDPESLFYLGLFCAYIERDEKQAIKCYRQAAGQGYHIAQYHLGMCYEKARGVEKNEKEAAACYRKAAEQGLSVAQNSLGNSYQTGRGVEKDEKEAIVWFRKAAVQGNSRAQTDLGFCYMMSFGVEKNEKESTAWFRKAAEQGYPLAQLSLGESYRLGRGVVKDEKLAVAWYRKSAEQGFHCAQHHLGLSYKNGQGVEKDEKEAAAGVAKAAEQGLRNAQSTLGGCYLTGSGVEKDEKKAVFWYHKAAEQGNSNAQNDLGGCYLRGSGVEKDEKEAVAWYRKAAEQGNSNAQNNLGQCYEEGLGVAKDEKEAAVWYRKADEQGAASSRAKAFLLRYNHNVQDSSFLDHGSIAQNPSTTFGLPGVRRKKNSNQQTDLSKTNSYFNFKKSE